MTDENNEIITGTVTEVDSGECWSLEFKPFPTDMALMAIIQVERLEIAADDDNAIHTQIIVECNALDSYGLVYKIDLEFAPETVAERDKIVADMKTGAIYMVKGRYSICQEEFIVTISEPEYRPLPPSFDEEEVREVFEVNGKPLDRIQ